MKLADCAALFCLYFINSKAFHVLNLHSMKENIRTYILETFMKFLPTAGMYTIIQGNFNCPDNTMWKLLRIHINNIQNRHLLTPYSQRVY